MLAAISLWLKLMSRAALEAPLKQRAAVTIARCSARKMPLWPKAFENAREMQ